MIKNNGCCDLKYAQRLKELKVKQDSLWWWVDYIDTSILPLNLEHQIRLVTKETMVDLKTHNKKYPHCATIKKLKIYSAFTVAELGEMLPAENEQKNKFDLVKRTPNKWEMNIFDKDGIYIETFTAKTEANTRAKMLIWLIEQEKVKVK